MLKALDKATALNYQNRSAFIRQAVKEKIQFTNDRQIKEKEFDEWLQAFIDHPDMAEKLLDDKRFNY